MCYTAEAGRVIPATAPAPPRYAGCKRPHALTLAVYDPAAAERRANAASLSASAGSAGALVPYTAASPAPAGEPINAVPLAVAAPGQATPHRKEPWWLRTHLLPHLKLRFDLPVHFIDEKTVTATDLDPHQNRFRLPTDGVWRNLRPLLTPLELEAASLLHEEAREPRPPKKKKQTVQGEQEKTKEKKEEKKKKKKKGKKHGGLPVLVIDMSAGIRELQLSRWESSRGTIIKGEGYLDFLNRCSFKVNDDVEIWAFKERRFRYFGVTMCDESPLYVLITKKRKQPTL